MKRIYDDARDKYVNSVVLYPDTNAILHYGAEPKTTDTDTVSAADLEELFLKNFIVIDAGDSGLIRPYLLTDETTYYAVTAIYLSSSTATAATYKSATISA